MVEKLKDQINLLTSLALIQILNFSTSTDLKLYIKL